MSAKRYFIHLGLMPILFLVALLGKAVAAPASDTPLSPQTGSGQLRLNNHQTHSQHEAILLSASAQVNLNPLAATVTFEQTFENNSADWVEGTYVFPLPENAAVDYLEMLIGDKKIVGKIRKKAQAKAIYQAAVNNGQKAALLESVRDNLFVAKVGNIPPNSKVTILLHYVQSVHYENGEFSWYLPGTYTPRYLVKNKSNHIPHVEDDTPMAKRTIIKNTALPSQHFSRSVNHPLSIKINLHAGHPIKHLHSPSHSLSKHFSDDKNSVSLHFAENTVAMDKDVILNWSLDTPNNTPLALAVSEKTSKGYFTSLLLMPPTQLSENHIARETVLIIDTSGSMSGVAMRQAKAGALDALSYLRPEDHFNLVAFNSDYTLLFEQSRQATTAHLNQAKVFIHSLSAKGGTEMSAPLKKVLTQPATETLLKQVVFLTDGSVNNEKNLFALINRHLGQARLFTVGIGTAPNHFFMRQAAEFGRGSFTYISHLSEVKSKINMLFKQLQHPTLTDMTVALPAEFQAQSYPNPIADLYVGQPVVAHIKTTELPDSDSINISGKTQGKNWVKSVSPKWLPLDSSHGLDKLWAREKINYFNKLNITSGDPHRHDADIEQLGLDYQLVTKKTAFVAVEEKLSRDPLSAAMQKKNIANQMPAGNSMAFPTTATSSTLTAILGGLALLAAALLALINHYRRDYRIGEPYA